MVVPNTYVSMSTYPQWRPGTIERIFFNLGVPIFPKIRKCLKQFFPSSVVVPTEDEPVDYDLNWYLSDGVLPRLTQVRARDAFRVTVRGVRKADSGSLRCTAKGRGRETMAATIMLKVIPSE